MRSRPLRRSWLDAVTPDGSGYRTWLFCALIVQVDHFEAARQPGPIVIYPVGHMSAIGTCGFRLHHKRPVVMLLLDSSNNSVRHYCGRPTRRSKSWKRGSERRSSISGSTFRYIIP